MALAAHKVTVSYWGAGASGFGTSGETLTLLSGTTYYPTSGRKNAVIQTDGLVTIRDGGVSIGSAFTVNHLQGTFTLDSAPAGTVTADWGYYGSVVAFEAREFSINLVRDELDDTVFGDNDKSTLLGLKGGGGTIGALELLTTEWNTAVPGYEQSIQSTWNSQYKFIIEVMFDATSRRTFRAFCKIPSLDLSGARDGLIEGSFPFIISQENTIHTPKTVSSAFFTKIA